LAKKLTLKPYEKVWRTNDGILAFKTYLRIANAILCRVDLRVGDADTYGFVHVFSGGWITMAEADGSMLKAHGLKPSDDHDKLIRALREDAKALAEEAQLVMTFSSQEGIGQGAGEENVEKEPREGD